MRLLADKAGLLEETVEMELPRMQGKAAGLQRWNLACEFWKFSSNLPQRDRAGQEQGLACRPARRRLPKKG
jgi:hypothetical protein